MNPPLRVGVAETGVTAGRLARLLGRADGRADFTLVPLARSTRGAAAAPSGLDVVVLSGAPGTHGVLARAALAAGSSVISICDSFDDVLALQALGPEAASRGAVVAVGAGFSPGLTCVLAARGRRDLDVIDEIHVAKLGTGGPTCARQHHWALRSAALDWRDGRWVRRPGGSGRELMWFPDPVAGADCYRASLPEALLLQPAFPSATRITARVAATRRDRITARLPMLRKPHPEGLIGAVRVELRGRVHGGRVVRVYGALAPPAAGAAAVVAASLDLLRAGLVARGRAAGLAELVPPAQFLTALRARGVDVFEFEGAVH